MRLWARAQLWWFERGESGATAVEYGLMVAAIAAVIVLVVFLLGRYVFGAFSRTCTNIAANSPPPPGAAPARAPFCSAIYSSIYR